MNMLEIALESTKVAEHWGKLMPIMACEEAGEFIQAISKLERQPSMTRKAELVDEVGDMWITLMAIQAHYDLDADAIDRRIEEKLGKKY